MTNPAQSPCVSPEFSFQATAVRTFADANGQPWFNASDVCTILGYRNPWDATAKHCRENGLAKHEVIDSMGRTQEATFINEGNLYRLIVKSRKPEAEAFEQWLMEEVLPAIRKTGSYNTPNPERLELAFALASEVADQAARTVFHAIMAGNEHWKQDRWLFCLNYDQHHHQYQSWAKAVERDALVISMAGLTRLLQEPDGLSLSNKELADLASACNQKLAQRLQHKAAQQTRQLPSR